MIHDNLEDESNDLIQLMRLLYAELDREKRQWAASHPDLANSNISNVFIGDIEERILAVEEIIKNNNDTEKVRQHERELALIRLRESEMELEILNNQAASNAENMSEIEKVLSTLQGASKSDD